MTADYCLLKNENKTVLSWKLVVDGGGGGMGQKEWGLDKFGVACAGDIIDCAVSHTIRPLLDQYPPHNLPINANGVTQSENKRANRRCHLTG